MVSFGARHVHPLVSGRMEYSAVLAGCQGCASIDGAALAGVAPTGTMPHALILVMGDTLEAAEAFDRSQDPEVPRIVLVDTFKDEAEESLRVARAMRERLARGESGHAVGTGPGDSGSGQRDTGTAGPGRIQLGDGLIVSGGLDPDRIQVLQGARCPGGQFRGGGTYQQCRTDQLHGRYSRSGWEGDCEAGSDPGVNGESEVEEGFVGGRGGHSFRF